MVVATKEAEQGREPERDDEHRQVEGKLVAGAEQVDDDLLGAGRLEVDDEGPDRGDERRGARDGARQQLAQRQAERTGDEARDGGAKALLHRVSEAHRYDGRVTPA